MKKIIFISGAFVHSCCWDNWKIYYQDKGYAISVPDWPMRDTTPKQLRDAYPDPALGQLGLSDVLAHFRELVAKDPKNTVLIGHSMGGLLVQLLLQEGWGMAGVALHSVPSQGNFSWEPSFLKSLWGPIGWYRKTRSSYLMPFEHWQYTFTNGWAPELQQSTYETYVVPESRRVLRDALGKQAKVDYQKKKVPLLFISGGRDHIMPASLNYDNYKRYEANPSLTAYREFRGRTHLVMEQQGWEEVAAFTLAWIDNLDNL